MEIVRINSKHKKTVLFITIPIVLVAVVVLLLQFTRYGYLMTLPYRSAFTEIDEHVYINKDYAGDRQELMEMIGQAKDRVNNFFGGLSFQDNTIFIIYDDENLRRKIGEDHAAIIFKLQLGVGNILSLLRVMILFHSEMKMQQFKYMR